jgi:hypothetical protein
MMVVSLDAERLLGAPWGRETPNASPCFLAISGKFKLAGYEPRWGFRSVHGRYPRPLEHSEESLLYPAVEAGPERPAPFR